MNVIQIQPDDKIGENTVAETAEYVQSNANKYIPKFYKMEKTGKKASFNWAAFFFGPIWFLYRKMYTYGIFIVLVNAMINIATTTEKVTNLLQNAMSLLNAFNLSQIDQATLQASVNEITSEYLRLPEVWIQMLAQLLIAVLIGVFANALYKKRVERNISIIKQTSSTPEEYHRRLFKTGGVSALAILIFIFAYIIIDFIPIGS